MWPCAYIFLPLLCYSLTNQLHTRSIIRIAYMYVCICISDSMYLLLLHAQQNCKDLHVAKTMQRPSKWAETDFFAWKRCLYVHMCSACIELEGREKVGRDRIKGSRHLPAFLCLYFFRYRLGCTPVWPFGGGGGVGVRCTNFGTKVNIYTSRRCCHGVTAQITTGIAGYSFTRR
jgi:hypothetical protein